MRVVRERGCNPGDIEPLTGIDDGQGFLKVGLVINDPKAEVENDSSSRSKYSEVSINALTHLGINY